MNAADGRGPVDRTVGRLLEHADFHAHIAPQDDEQRQWAADLRSAAAELEHYAQATAAQAAELDRLLADNQALREALAGAVTVLDLLRTHAGAKYEYASSRAGTLVHVAPTIDAAAALLTPNRG